MAEIGDKNKDYREAKNVPWFAQIRSDETKLHKVHV
jgi:hypothetical protein